MIVTLTTDFGEKSGYVGVMKGVIYGMYPAARLVDISHYVKPQKIAEGAFLIQTIMREFPPGTVHLAVVDPGVGTARRGIVLRVPEIGYFVGPDNGIFSYVIDAYPNLQARQITNPAFMRHPVSVTFHGRDVFAPTAALLARGEDFAGVGELLDNSHLVKLTNYWAKWYTTANSSLAFLKGTVVHIDHFGNLITNIHQNMLTEKGLPVERVSEVSLRGSFIELRTKRIETTYGNVAPGEYIALFGSSGFLEFAKVNGRASDIAPSEDMLYSATVTVTFRT
jgi:S-adenosyl-L-methionine hydrolase (adenosine-forming)